LYLAMRPVSPTRSFPVLVDGSATHLYIRLGSMKKKTIIGVIITAGLVVGLLKAVPPGEVLPYLRATRPFYFALACLLNFGTIFLRARRWQILVSAVRRVPFLSTFRMLTVGLAVNSVVPLRAGEAVRSYSMAVRTGIGKRESVSTVLLDKSFDAISFGILLLLATRFFRHPSWTSVSTYGFFLSSIALVVSIPLVAWLGRSVKDRPREHFGSELQHKIAVKLEPLSRGYASLTPWASIRSGTLSLAAWGFQFAVAVVAARAVGVELPLSGLVMAVFAVNAASTFPLTPANVGVFQIAFLVTLSAYGAERSSSLAAATVFQTAMVVPVTLLGLLLLHRGSRPSEKEYRNG
jgi:uncharacterized protein (TIRG00374 family)